MYPVENRLIVATMTMSIWIKAVNISHSQLGCASLPLSLFLSLSLSSPLAVNILQPVTQSVTQFSIQVIKLHLVECSFDEPDDNKFSIKSTYQILELFGYGLYSLWNITMWLCRRWQDVSYPYPKKKNGWRERRLLMLKAKSRKLPAWCDCTLLLCMPGSFFFCGWWWWSSTQWLLCLTRATPKASVTLGVMCTIRFSLHLLLVLNDLEQIHCEYTIY